MINIYTIRITNNTKEKTHSILLQYSEEEYNQIPKSLKDGLESLGCVYLNDKKIVNYSLI